MGFRFHKSFRLIPGVRANIGKTGPSLSVGGRGLSFNFGRRGTRTTASLPGTGLSYSTQRKGNKGGLLAILVGIGAALFGLVRLGLPNHESAPVAPVVASAPAEAAKPEGGAATPELRACQAAVHAVRAALLAPGKVHFFDCRRSPQAFTITSAKAGSFGVKSTIRAENATGSLTTRHWSATVAENGAVSNVTHD